MWWLLGSKTRDREHRERPRLEVAVHDLLGGGRTSSGLRTRIGALLLL